MSLGISSSSARLLHSGVLHVSLTSFVLGTDYAPLKNPAALPRPSSILRQLTPRIFISGDGQAYRSSRFVRVEYTGKVKALHRSELCQRPRSAAGEWPSHIQVRGRKRITIRRGHGAGCGQTGTGFRQDGKPCGRVWMLRRRKIKAPN